MTAYPSEPTLDHCRRSRERIAAESVAHIAAIGALARQLLAEREYWATVALEHGATFGEVTAAMSAGGRADRAELHGNNIERPARDAGAVAVVYCVDCNHRFHPDSSPDLDRCWQCAERHEESSKW
ncbi:MAG TPA: hypothetical protein VGH89_26295 [Pseudonocardia sp.]